MTDCERIQELIPWYASGTLTEQESREVTAHLVSCEACQEELALALRLKRRVEADSQHLPRIPDAAWQRVAAEAFGRPIAKIDVGSFLLGFSFGANRKRGRIPVYGDLRVLGRKVRLFNVEREEST